VLLSETKRTTGANRNWLFKECEDTEWMEKMAKEIYELALIK
jgi:hypothetical protein